MTALDLRPPEPDLDLRPWRCPACGYANDGIRGFCTGCRRQRPERERPVAQPAPPEPARRPSRAARPARPAPPPPPYTPGPAARSRTAPGFGPKEIVATVSVVVLFVSGVLAAIGRNADNHSHNKSIVAPATAPASTPAPSPKSWDPRVLDIVHFVEQRRGLTFKHPVAVEFLTDAVFNKVVDAGGSSPSGAREQQELDQTVATLRAVGLAEGSPDLKAAGQQVAAQAILGLYVPHDKRVYVRGSNLTVDVRVVLAHELTHALQDQYFGLDHLTTGSDGETTAFRALAEADAVRIEDAYVDTLSSSDAKTFEATRSQQAKDAEAPNVPEAMLDDLDFPYVFGPAFVGALEEQAGNDSVDNAFRKPPQSEAQIVDPPSYLAGVKVTKVAAPQLTGSQHRVEKAHDIGQISLLEVLGSRLDYNQAWTGVQGWTGDQGLSYSENGKVCFLGDVAFKDAASADTFAGAAQAWAVTMPEASTKRVSPTLVELRSCDPGPAYHHATPQPSAFKTLGVRAELISGLHQAGVKYNVGACTADGAIAKLGPAKIVAVDNIDNDSDPRVVEVRRAVQQAASACRRTAGV